MFLISVSRLFDELCWLIYTQTVTHTVQTPNIKQSSTVGPWAASGSTAAQQGQWLRDSQRYSFIHLSCGIWSATSWLDIHHFSLTQSQSVWYVWKHCVVLCSQRACLWVIMCYCLRSMLSRAGTFMLALGVFLCDCSSLGVWSCHKCLFKCLREKRGGGGWEEKKEIKWQWGLFQLHANCYLHMQAWKVWEITWHRQRSFYTHGHFTHCDVCYKKQ